MGVQTGCWLLLLLPVAVVTGPLHTAERKLDQSQDLTPVHSLPGQQLSEPVACVQEQQQSPPDAVGDFVQALRDGWSKHSELGKEELARFGFCSHSDRSEHQQFSSVLMLGQKAHEENSGPGYFHTQKEHWDVEDDGKFTLTFHLMKPCMAYQQNTVASVVILFFMDTTATEELNLKFSSHGLQPNKQAVCVSKNTQFLLLTADQTKFFTHAHLKLRIVVDAKNDSGQKIGLADLQAILMKRDIRTNTPLSPVVLVYTHGTNSVSEASHSNQTFFFLCELQTFLKEVLPQGNAAETPEEASVSMNVLHSLPPLKLGVSSSESVLLELINSSSHTVFSFPRQSLGLQGHRVELALNPVLLSVLRLRLDEAIAQIHKEEAGHSVKDKLQILTALTALPDDGQGVETGLENTNEVQYRALLLLKALQAVLGIWAAERTQRAARADQDGTTKPTQCRLQSLTVSLEKYLLEPATANINNCEGTCGFPLTSGNNHAILLNSHVQSGQPLNRTLCCVPVEYDDLSVIELDSDGTTISYKTNTIAKSCECR
ncbi:muellerian-inhibiting factor [Astyanax mexicanus]|uniref:Anti-Mullerian hormone n=1 Tax=Astyanax mexicanus TaxID=7994 RepID=A0A8B9L0X7_ASTMX|nr:muellerian-inhibiting factor [Astyanax mexicanus]